MTNEKPPPSHPEGPAADAPSGFFRDHDLSYGPVCDIATAQALHTLRQCSGLHEPRSDDDILLEFHNALVRDAEGEQLLFTQSRTLDALYNRLVVQALTSPYIGSNNTGYIGTETLRLALAAQKQCRHVITSLATKKRTSKSRTQTQED